MPPLRCFLYKACEYSWEKILDLTGPGSSSLRPKRDGEGS
jgi:hypothetical protein